MSEASTKPPIGRLEKVNLRNFWLDEARDFTPWLANTLAPYGHYLQAGQVIMPGSLVAAVDAKPGGHIRADFDHIGSVELRLR